MVICITLSGNSFAGNPTSGWGQVNMQGAILYTACAISTGSREQVIDMDIAPISEIRNSGRSTERDFSIDLVNCLFTNDGTGQGRMNYFNITFDGNSEGDVFSVGGEAKGIALQISDAQGHLAFPGIMLPAKEIDHKAMKLNYVMRLVSNNKPVKAGEYFSAIRFKLDYY